MYWLPYVYASSETSATSFFHMFFLDTLKDLYAFLMCFCQFPLYQFTGKGKLASSPPPSIVLAVQGKAWLTGWPFSSSKSTCAAQGYMCLGEVVSHACKVKRRISLIIDLNELHGTLPVSVSCWPGWRSRWRHLRWYPCHTARFGGDTCSGCTGGHECAGRCAYVSSTWMELGFWVRMLNLMANVLIRSCPEAACFEQSCMHSEAASNPEKLPF